MELEKLLEKINKDRVLVKRGSEIPGIKRISTGSLAMDYLLGGGIPVGKIVEFQGVKSSGKSLICLKIANQVIESEGRDVLWVDLERSWDTKWTEKHIHNLDKVYVLHPENAEQAIEVIKQSLLVDNPPRLVVIDSVAAISPNVEMEKSFEDESVVAVAARLIGRMIRVLNTLAYEKECAIVLINQLRDVIGGFSPFGKKEIAPGGRAREFFNSAILDFRPGEWIKDGNRVIGHNLKVQVKKSKVSGIRPLSDISFVVYHDCRLDEELGDVVCPSCSRHCPNKEGFFEPSLEAITVGMELGIISRSGPYYIIGEKKFRGREELLKNLTSEILGEVEAECRRVIGNG